MIWRNLRNIFEGNKSAYGQLILTGETTEKGKAIGKAFIKREPIPEHSMARSPRW